MTRNQGTRDTHFVQSFNCPALNRSLEPGERNIEGRKGSGGSEWSGAEWKLILKYEGLSKDRFRLLFARDKWKARRATNLVRVLEVAAEAAGGIQLNRMELEMETRSKC